VQQTISDPARWPRAGVGLAVGATTGLLIKDLDLLSLVSYWGQRAPLVVLTAAAGALVWQTRLRGLFGAAAAGLATVWLAVAFTPVCRWLAADLPRRDPKQDADAVFVLSSRIQEDGELTTPAMSRLLHGLELLGEGRAPRLILSELRAPFRSYAAAARPLMDRVGLRREVVTVGPVGNTRDEAVALGRLFRERGWQRLLVVTGPTHSLRACATIEREGIEVVCSPSTETRFDLETLGRPDERLDAFGSVIHETAGIWVYGRRGWLR
jgi:uncharacterized SAM-binding protein YcdF (DUF218 family)